MQTAKPTIPFRYDHYDIELDVIGERTLAITVIDSLARIEFHEKELQLETIGTNTLLKAFDRSKKQIQVKFSEKHIAENHLLEITISVESPFLKPVEQTILLKKVRDIGEAEAVKKSIDRLSRRIKEIKQNGDKNKLTTYVGTNLDQKFYNNNSTYEPLVSIKLPKGKYMLTFSYLLKAQNQWFYVYLNQGESVIQNCGYYVPTTSQFMPHTIRKIHTVKADNDTVSFTTNSTSSYPVTLKNCIITARPLPE